MKEYEELGHMEPANSQEGKNACYFLPHHPVFKETSSTIRSQMAAGESAKPSDGTVQQQSMSPTCGQILLLF